MKTVSVKIPQNLVKEFEAHGTDLREILITGLSYVKAKDALDYYKKGLVSMVRAAEIANLPRLEMIRLARASGLNPQYDQQMIKEEFSKKK